MPNTQFMLKEVFAEAIRTAFPDLEGAPVSVQAAQSEKFGDYQCNSAMVINQVMCEYILDIFFQMGSPLSSNIDQK